MKPKDIETVFAAPIFLFLSLILFLLTLGSIMETMNSTPSHLLVACILFILGYNCFRIGMKMMKS